MEEKRQSERKKLLEGVRQVMSTSEGRALMRHIMGQCRVLRADFVADSATMYYLQGQRAVGLDLLELIKDENPANVAALLLEEEHGRRK